jgi:hypothetical protein
MFRRAVLFSLAYAGSLAWSGCGVDDRHDDNAVGQTQSAAGACLTASCNGSPPPASISAPPNTATIPPSYISDKLADVLTGTVVQVSQTTGDTPAFPEIVSVCTTDAAAASACIQNVCTGMAGRAYMQCESSCRGQNQTCTPVCSSTQQMSFIRWSEIAKEQSKTETCSRTTCPACTVPTDVPSLQDEPLFIPTFTRSVTVFPWPTITVTCRINQWQFRVPFTLSVTSSSTGLTLQVPGMSGSPAISCAGMPDISASGLGLELTFHPSMSGGVLAVSADGTLDGTFDGGIISVLVDLNSVIKGQVHDQLTGTLNSGSKPAEYVDMFNALITQFLSDNQLPAVTTLLSVTTTDQGLVVTYY